MTGDEPGLPGVIFTRSISPTVLFPVSTIELIVGAPAITPLVRPRLRADRPADDERRGIYQPNRVCEARTVKPEEVFTILNEYTSIELALPLDGVFAPCHLGVTVVPSIFTPVQ